MLLCFVLVSVLPSAAGREGARRSFRVGDRAFVLDGQPVTESDRASSYFLSKQVKASA